MFSHAQLVCFSPTGTSFKIGKALADALGVMELSVQDLTRKAADTCTVDLPTIFVVPVYAGRVPNLACERMEKIRGEKTPAIIIVVYGNRHYEDALVELEDLVCAQGFVPVAGAACVAEHSFSREGLPMAEGRPDRDDLAKVYDFAKNIIEQGVDLEGRSLKLPGNRPYRNGMPTLPFHPVQIVDEVAPCRAAVDACPVHAISIRGGALYWQEGKCILCCACIKACPAGSIGFADPSFAQMEQNIYKLCLERRAPEFFLLK